MKVLELLCEPISNGGQEAFVMNIYNNIDMTDLQIDLFTPYYCDNNFYKNQVKARGGKIYARGLSFNPGGLKFNIIAPIRAIIRKNKYDVVHIHSGSVLSLACASFAARLEKVDKIIVHSHSTADVHTLKRDMIKKIATPIINKCSTDFFACSKKAGEWKFSKKICKNKLKVIKNGINIDKFVFNNKIRNDIRSEMGIDDNTMFLGHVGRFSYEKNQEFLIELLDRLVKNGEKAKLLLIGTGETEDKVRKLVEEYGLKDRVIFKGNVNNVYDYMQAMDIFVLPSRFEGLGIVAIEAQAAGLPVVTSTEVPKDIVITKNVQRVDLEDIDKWIKSIKSFKNIDREDTAFEIKKAGYDIYETAKKLKIAYGFNNIKKVLVFGMTPNYGGVESFILNYYSNMDRSKIRFDFLCNTKDDIAYTKQLEEMGSTIYHITPKGKNYIKYKKELNDFFKKNSSNYDVFWMNVCNLVNIDYLKAAKKYGIRNRIIHSHNSENYERNWRDIMHTIHKKTISRYATDFWACSKEAAEWFYSGNILKNSLLIYNAIDIKKLNYNEEKRKEIRDKYDLNDKFVIGNIGRLTYQKNQMFLLQIMKELNEDYKLVIVGMGEEEMTLKQAAKHMDVEDKVLFAGAQTDIQGWLSCFDVFAFPSHYEGLSIALMEVQANGLPVIASPKAVAEDAMINNNIILCDTEDIYRWAEIIEEKRKNQDRLDLNSVNNNFKKSNFDISKEAKKIQNLILER